MENGPIERVDFPINSMVIFHCYVSSPEGMPQMDVQKMWESTESTMRKWWKTQPSFFGAHCFSHTTHMEISSHSIPACTIQRLWKYDELWKYGNTQLSPHISLFRQIVRMFVLCFSTASNHLFVSDPPARPDFWLRLPFASASRSHPQQKNTIWLCQNSYWKWP